MSANTLDVGTAVEGARVIVLAGAGGVGKTTVAAAVGLGLAREGRRICVLTIDPARRLADALGVTAGDDGPTRVPVDDADGELWIEMLDAKATFDGLVHRYSASPAVAERVLANRTYRELSGSVAGSQEYMAVERLRELLETGRFDAVVLDTPPTRNALDFLDAPQRLHGFLDSKAIQILLKPAAGGLGLIGRGAGVFTGLLKRITGVDMLADLSEFLSASSGMIEGFSGRARAVEELLADPTTTFLLVGAPRDDALGEVAAFRAVLERRGLTCGGVVVNRVAPAAPEAPGDAVREAVEASTGDADLGDAVAAAHAGLVARVEHDVAAVEAHLAAAPKGDRARLVRERERDVHDVDSLAGVATDLFAVD